MGEVDKKGIMQEHQSAIIRKKFNEAFERFVELMDGLESDGYPTAAREMVLKQANSYLKEMDVAALK